ncbi:hypothetical protein [Alloactinosynnema sp. L-07]|uniref:hypothetical protein n=1 Tax=Alloactinosynnema sp. L-07 TaxID=1653480 RepID=UPI00065F0713|nr:hypothetical protein [Alloactinosynnema sp. L-07]CRK59392.1 hypothetical protein [Alloactinosynnema sp. L-07]
MNAPPPLFIEVCHGLSCEHAMTHDRFTLRNLYLYLVCLVMLVIATFAAVTLVRATVELAYPEPYVAFEGKDPAGGTRSPDYEQAARDSQRRQAVLSLVGSGTTLLLAGPIYVYHWRRIQAELPNTGDNAAD